MAIQKLLEFVLPRITTISDSEAMRKIVSKSVLSLRLDREKSYLNPGSTFYLPPNLDQGVITELKLRWSAVHFFSVKLFSRSSFDTLPKNISQSIYKA